MDQLSKRRRARTWYAEASPGERHFVVLVAAPLMVLVLIVVAVVVLALFGVSAGGAL
jgi:hypothetical protein